MKQWYALYVFLYSSESILTLFFVTRPRGVNLFKCHHRPYPRSPHFPCRENADGSIRTGTRRNLRILVWQKMQKKCGGNAEKMRMGVFGQERGEISAFLYGKKCGGNGEKMRMGVFGQEYGEISASYPHFSHNAEIMRRIFPHSQFSASQP